MNMNLKKTSQLHLFLNSLFKSMRFIFKKVNTKLKFSCSQNCPFNFKKQYKIIRIVTIQT